MNDPEINRYLESRFEKHTIASLRCFVKTVNESGDFHFFKIIDNEAGQHIGNIKLGPVHLVHGVADIGLLIGEKRCWGKGYAKEAIGLLCDHAFLHLGLHKVTAGFYDKNIASEKAFLANGFCREGVRQEQVMLDGKYASVVIMGRINDIAE